MTRLGRYLLLLLAGCIASATHAQPTAVTAPTQYVNVGGDRIAYRSIGSGAPMLLLNRMRGTIDTWDPLYLDLLARSNRVVVVDYPGVGYSGGRLPPDMGKAAAFVADFATAIGLDRFVLMGWSWGGFVTQTFVVEHPGRATHAILVGTNPPGRNQFPIQQAFLDRALKPVNDLADEEVLFFEPKSEASRRAARASHDRIHARADVAARIPSKADDIQAFIQAHASFRDDPSGRRQKLATSRTPMLIVCGDNDISNPVQNWYPLVGELPNAHLVVYPESGHGPQHQYPELTAQIVEAFLRNAVR